MAVRWTVRLMAGFLSVGTLSPLMATGLPLSPSKLHLRSSVALVQDQRTGEYLVEKQASTVVPIASITKLMTAMVVLDAGLNLNEPLTIAPEDVDLLRRSRSRLPVNTTLTRGETLLVALMASENRAAHALGRTYPGGLGAFVAAMNAKGKVLGLMETRFEDPAGLSGGNVASARDLAKLVNAAHRYSKIREFSTRDQATIRSGRRSLQFVNTNALVRGIAGKSVSRRPAISRRRESAS